jgi:hypothetical protein
LHSFCVEEISESDYEIMKDNASDFNIKSYYSKQEWLDKGWRFSGYNQKDDTNPYWIGTVDPESL